MKPLIDKIKPASGYAQFVHVGFNLLLPLAVFILVRINFVQLALAIILLSKWRMFAVRPRFWPTNIRANAVDIIVGISLLLFMTHSGSQLMQFLWVLVYGFWLVTLKPGSSVLLVSTQAMTGMLFGLVALFLAWTTGPLYGIVFLTGLICYLSARHFFDSFDEPYAKLLSYAWGYFAVCLTWVLGHWLISFPHPESTLLPQPVVILLVIGFGLGGLYYLEHLQRLAKLFKMEFAFVVSLTVVAMIVYLMLDIARVRGGV